MSSVRCGGLAKPEGSEMLGSNPRRLACPHVHVRGKKEMNTRRGGNLYQIELVSYTELKRRNVTCKESTCHEVGCTYVYRRAGSRVNL